MIRHARALLRIVAGSRVAGRDDPAALPGCVDDADWPADVARVWRVHCIPRCNSDVPGRSASRGRRSPGSLREDKSAAPVPFRAPPCVTQAGLHGGQRHPFRVSLDLSVRSHLPLRVTTSGPPPLPRQGPFSLPPILSTIQRPDDRTDDCAFGADDVASGLTLRKLRFQMIDDSHVWAGRTHPIARCDTDRTWVPLHDFWVDRIRVVDDIVFLQFPGL